METSELPPGVQVVGVAFGGLLLGLLCWLGVREASTTDGRLAAEEAVQHLQPADLAAVTVQADAPGAAWSVQQRPADSGPLLLALRQLRPVAVNKKTLYPQALATVSLQVGPAAQARWHLRQPAITFRLANSSRGDIAQRPASNIIYRSSLLSCSTIASGSCAAAWPPADTYSLSALCYVP